MDAGMPGSSVAVAPTVSAFVYATAVLAAASFIAAGMVAWRVRPHNRLGLLSVVVGVLWILAKFPLWLPEWAHDWARGAWAAVLVHLVLAVPTGRLDRPASRAVVALAYVTAAVAVLLDTLAPPGGDELNVAAVVGGAVGGLLVVALQLARWHDSSPSQRRALTPVFAAAALAAALFVVSRPVAAAGVVAPLLTAATQVAFAAMPLAYLAGVLRRRIDRGGVAELVVRLDQAPEPTSFQRALSETLHDPTLRVGYWIPASERYVDFDGHPFQPSDAGRRATTRVDRHGSPLVVVEHDPALLDEPGLIDAACAAAALVLENERLTAELRARVRQLADSRSHVLRVAEDERRRLERDLHDGVQQRLLSIPMVLSLAESAVRERPESAGSLIAEAKSTTLAVLAELRALSQGIHPPILTERGLHGAVREAAALAPVPVDVAVKGVVRLPAEIETTAYYVVAEALAKVAKHAKADHARVRIEQADGKLSVEVDDDGRGGADLAAGAGLRGLADRVADNGGVLEVSSPSGGGSRVRAVMPCE
jgi:signal transduction histidine kinase